VLARRALRAFMAIRAADELGAQMLNVAVGWQLYATTRDPMSLAYVGLAQFLPDVGLLLVAGQAADRFDRRAIVAASLAVQTLCLAAFAVWWMAAAPSVGPVYGLLLLIGAARAFLSPALSASLPNAVDAEDFPRAVAGSSSLFQICAIVGPALGGLLYAQSSFSMFTVAAAVYALALTEARHLPRGRRPASGGAGDRGLLGGIRYVRSNRLLLALISLDLFAVLLGGVSALLPIYARDVLAVGPVGLGCLRCAPGAGAAVVGLALAHRPIERSAGKTMLACVAGFGLATVLFALSANVWLSLAALAIAGGFDMVSMAIRQTLVQISTPDAMRGRVSALNWLFIGASAQLGEFESGVAAALLGTVPAALLGGLGTLAVVALWTKLFPELRAADKLVPRQARGDPDLEGPSENQAAAGTTR
jgi:MFS family permease